MIYLLQWKESRCWTNNLKNQMTHLKLKALLKWAAQRRGLRTRWRVGFWVLWFLNYQVLIQITTLLKVFSICRHLTIILEEEGSWLWLWVLTNFWFALKRSTQNQMMATTKSWLSASSKDQEWTTFWSAWVKLSMKSWYSAISQKSIQMQ